MSSGSSPGLQQYSYSTFDAIRRHAQAFDGALAWAGLGKMFVEAVAIVCVVGLAASLVPAWRASRLDPSEILREG